MTPSLWRSIVLVTTCLVLALLMAAPAFAQDQAFKDGMEAYDSRSADRWQKVAMLMRRAIEANAEDSGRKVQYGGTGFGGLRVREKTAAYLPHFYLGEALFNLNDCVGAIEAWIASEKQPAVRTYPEFTTIIQNGYIVCKAKGVLPPGEFDSLADNARKAYAEASALAGAVSALGQQNLDQWRSDLKEQYDKATSELEAARTHIATGTRMRSQKEFDAAISAVERARGIVVTVQASLRAAIDVTRSAQALAREVEQVLENAGMIERQIDARLEGKKPALSASLTTARQQGHDALNRGRERLAAGVKTSSTSAMTEARTLGQDAESRFKQVLDELSKLIQSDGVRQLSDARSRGAQTAKQLDELFLALDKRLAANPSLGATIGVEQEAIRKQADTARRRLDDASKKENVPGIVQATSLASKTRDQLADLISKFGPLTLRERGVSQALEEGSQKFFAGQYQEARELLNRAAADDSMQLHVHLFRAATLHELFVRSREVDQALRAQAFAEVAECKKIDSAFEPDPRVFSPRFIAFFRNGTATNERVASAQP